MKESDFDAYSALLDSEALFGDLDNSLLSLGNRKKKIASEDMETFITDEEIEKAGLKQDEDSYPDRRGNSPRPIEEVVTFKRYNTRHIHKYTETEMAAIRKSCEETIVHDYSEHDTYHMSDEERAKHDSLAQLRVKIGSLHSIYTRVDEYIKAMRVFVEAWELLEKKDNFVHSEEEFFNLVAKGKIYNSSIIMPRLRKMEKYNIDLLIKYISNPELDPEDLLDPKYKEDKSWYEMLESDEEPESDEEKFERLMSPEEALYVENNEDNPPSIEVKDIKRKYIKGYDQKRFSSTSKKLSKVEKYKMDSIHEILNKIQNSVADDRADRYSRSWFITSSLFDTSKEPESVYDKIHFDGSWTSEDDLFLYDLAIQEAIANEHPIGERYLTNSEKQLSEFFRTMEQEGLNVVELRRLMNMSEGELKTAETKSVKKENKKREAAIIQRITKLNNNPKFKKLITKAEKSINEQLEKY